MAVEKSFEQKLEQEIEAYSRATLDSLRDNVVKNLIGKSDLRNIMDTNNEYIQRIGNIKALATAKINLEEVNKILQFWLTQDNIPEHPRPRGPSYRI